MRSRTVILLLPLLLLAPSVGSGQQAFPEQPRLEIPLTVVETAGINRSREPVSLGVPLPATGGFRDPDGFTVRDPRGVRVPTQTRVLARWNGPPEDPSRPIRWLWVHFQADVAAGASAEYTLTPATAPPTDESPLVRRSSDGLRVDTGPVGFTVAPDRFRVLEDLRIDIDGDGELDIDLVRAGHDGGVFVKRPDGSLHRPEEDTDVTLTLEDNGPLTATIRVEGRHPTGTATPERMEDGRPPHPWLEFSARLRVFRGKPWVRLSYTVGNPERFLTGAHNRGGQPVAHEFESLSLILPVETLGDPLTLTLGGEAVAPWAPESSTPPPTARPAWKLPLETSSTAILYQDSSGVEGWEDSEDGTWGTGFRGYVASVDSQGIGRGHHAAGWADVSSLAWGVTVGIDDFWQNFPTGLRISGRGQIAFDLWPEQSRGLHRLAGGRRKTHELFLDFHRGAGADVAAFSGFSRPLRATAPAAWIRDTLALGPVGITGESTGETWRIDRLAEALLDPDEGLAAERVRTDAHGWRNWGDTYRAGDKNHRTFGNNEFDFGWGLLGLYLLDTRQDPRYFELAEPMLRHLADIDIYHTDEDASAYSRGIRQHDGSGTTDHSRPPILSHAWIRGLLTHHLITGERWSLDAALEVGRWIEGLVDVRTGELDWNGQTRSQAWAALALTELWETTGDGRWLDVAGRLLHAEILADQDMAGAPWPCPGLDWEGDRGERDRDSASPWQNGYAAEALGRYALARRLAGAPDTAAEQGLFRLLDAIAECGFATPDNGLFVPGDEDRDDEVYGRRYRSLVVDRIHPDGSYAIRYANNHLLTDGFAYGALFTPDESARRRYLELARESWIWTMGPESRPGDDRSPVSYCCPATPAKNAAMALRFGRVWLWLQQRLEGPAVTARD